MNGASTNTGFSVVAWAWNSVKNAIERYIVQVGGEESSGEEEKGICPY